MEPTVLRDQRVMWAFWLACGLSAVGALAPFVTSASTQSRISGVFVPFAIATAAFAANALTYHKGRSLAAALYFAAGIAIVYGILAMVAVPIRLAVVGTCPPAPLQCPLGFEPALTSGEETGFGIAAFCGVLAVFIGFFGLLVLYRRRTVAARQQTQTWAAQAPLKPAATTIDEPAPKAPAEPAARPTAVPGAQSHDEFKELPAPVEPKELTEGPTP